MVNHGGPTSSERHVGDLGNIESNGPSEPAVLNFTDPYVALYDANDVIGRSVVVHALADDLGMGGDDGSRTTGNAGARLACGVIGICAPFTPPTTPTTYCLRNYP